jgi:hypothetical protein
MILYFASNTMPVKIILDNTSKLNDSTDLPEIELEDIKKVEESSNYLEELSKDSRCPNEDGTIGSSNNKYLFALSEVVDKGGPTSNPFILVKRQMESDKPIDAEIINKILAHRGIKITEEELNELSNLSFFTFNLPLSVEDRKKISNVIGSSEPKGTTKSHQCVYIFTDKTTNKKYVGSTKNSGQRIRVYFKKGAGSTVIRGSFGKYLKEKGINNLTLSVAIIHKEISRELLHVAFEQYLFLKLKPEFNDVYVAGSGGITIFSNEELIKKRKLKGTALYAYIEESSPAYQNYLLKKFSSSSKRDVPTENTNNANNLVLVHTFYSYKHAGTLLPCRWDSIRDSVLGNRSIFGVKFSTQEIESVKFDYMPIESLYDIMSNHKTQFSNRRGKKPTIIHITHRKTNESWQFKNIPDFNRFLESISLKKISINKFKRHISTGDNLYNFSINKYQIEDAPSIVFQAYKFDADHYLSTKLSKIYPLKDKEG